MASDSAVKAADSAVKSNGSVVNGPSAPASADDNATKPRRAKGRARRASIAQRGARPGRRRTLAALGIAGVAGAAAIATTVGGDDPDSRAKANGLGLRLPAGWEQRDVNDAWFVKSPRTIAAAPSNVRGATLLAGIVSDMPAARHAIDDASPAGSRRTRVRLGRFDAWRYEGLSLRRGLAADAYVTYTTAGPLVILCRARRDALAHLAQCAAAAETIKLNGDVPLSLTAVTRRTRSLRAALRTLRAEHSEARRRLAEAQVAADQITAARTLETSFRTAAQRVASIDSPPGTPNLQPLVTALTATAGGYRELATAVSEGDGEAYDVARESILDVETRLRAAAAGAVFS